MDVFICGLSGLVGSNIAVEASQRGHAVVGTYHSSDPAFDADVETFQADICETDRIETLLNKVTPDCVINAAAMTDVDQCEQEPNVAKAVNGDAPAALAGLCQERDTDFVHFSTDYVFDGTSDEPYTEDAGRNPIQRYGETKLAGERGVEANHSSPLVLRVSFVYGYHQSQGELDGFPRWVLDTFAADETAPLFVDQHVSPTHAGQVAETTVDLLTDGYTGTYHATSRTCTTPYDFGDAVRTLAGAPETAIAQSSQEDVARPADRPRNTCLEVQRVEETLGRPQPTLATDLQSIEGEIQRYIW